VELLVAADRRRPGLGLVRQQQDRRQRGDRDAERHGAPHALGERQAGEQQQVEARDGHEQDARQRADQHAVAEGQPGQRAREPSRRLLGARRHQQREAGHQGERGKRLREVGGPHEPHLGRSGVQQAGGAGHAAAGQPLREAAQGEHDQRGHQRDHQRFRARCLPQGQQQRVAHRVLPVAHALVQDDELLLEELQVAAGGRGDPRALAQRLGDEAIGVLVVRRHRPAQHSVRQVQARREHERRRRQRRRQGPGAERGEPRAQPVAERQPAQRAVHERGRRAPEREEHHVVRELVEREVVHRATLRDAEPLVEDGGHCLVPPHHQGQQDQAGEPDPLGLSA
jgi:hypothetical protein